jgi:hypothetical protein
MRNDHRVVASRDHDNVMIFNRARLVERAVIGVYPLEGEALGRTQAVIIGFLQLRFARRIFAIVLVRRVAAGMSRRRTDFDDQQVRGRWIVMRQDVADIARVAALAPYAAAHRIAVDQPDMAKRGVGRCAANGNFRVGHCPDVGRDPGWNVEGSRRDRVKDTCPVAVISTVPASTTMQVSRASSTTCSSCSRASRSARNPTWDHPALCGVILAISRPAAPLTSNGLGILLS